MIFANLIPESLLDSLAILPANRAIAGLLRHAERPAIITGEFGNDLNLTENGRESCKTLAKNLSMNLNEVYSSPVKRCLQTANFLLDGVKNSQIQTSSLLGEPGIFIVNWDQAHNYCREHDPFVIVKELISKDENPPGFCSSTYNTVFDLIRFLLKKMIKDPGLSLFITHDSILSVVLGIIFEDVELEYLWPFYLEAMFFWEQDSFLHIIYRGKYKKLLWIN